MNKEIIKSEVMQAEANLPAQGGEHLGLVGV